MDRTVEDVAVDLAEVKGMVSTLTSELKGTVSTLTSEVAGMRREFNLMLTGTDGNLQQKHLMLTQRVQGLEAKLVLHDSTFDSVEHTLNQIQYGLPAARRNRITDRSFVMAGTLIAASLGALLTHVISTGLH